MRVGFISARFASRATGALVTEAGVGRVLDALATRCDLTVAMSIVEGSHVILDHVIPVPPERFVPLPAMPSFTRGFYKHRESVAAIQEVEHRSDVLIVQLPFSAPTALLAIRMPTVFQACADVAAVVRNSGRYRGAARYASLAAAEASESIHRYVSRRANARVVAHGAALRARYEGSPGVAVVSSTLRREDIGSVHRVRSTDAPFRVLFVGHLRAEKGIDVLVAAFERLVESIPEAELHIVGPEPTDHSAVGAQVRARLGRFIERGSVQLLGPVDFGPKLFQCFADADALALPSRSEGTPRVLVEARAFGCPVIASRVGGIPSSVRDDVDGLLVPPGDVSALTEALLRLINEEGLRDRLVTAGFERARETTVERLAETLLDQAGRAAG